MRFTRRRLDSSGGDATQAAEVAIQRTVAEGCIGGGGFLVFVRFLSLSLSLCACVVTIRRTAVDGCTGGGRLLVLALSLSLYVGGRDGVGVGVGVGMGGR